MKVNEYLPSMKFNVYSSDLHVQGLGTSERACAEVDNHFSKEFSTCPARNTMYQGGRCITIKNTILCKMGGHSLPILAHEDQKNIY